MSISCDDCQHKANNTCTALFSSPCDDFRQIPYIDPDIITSAVESHDHRMHKGNRYSSRNVQKSEENFHKANAPKRVIEQGCTLFYKNKYTGDICSGTVVYVSPTVIRFRFDNREANVNHTFINQRLFYTPEEAKRYGAILKAKK